MAVYVSRVYVEILGETIDCKSVTFKGSNALAPVGTMNRLGENKGYTEENVTHEFDLEAPIDNDLDLDYYAIMKDKTEFSTTFERDNGTTVTLLRCRIADVEESASDAGEATQKLSCQALSRV